jgi:tetratricopeptide (TPR) repeat protein
MMMQKYNICAVVLTLALFQAFLVVPPASAARPQGSAAGSQAASLTPSPAQEEQRHPPQAKSKQEYNDYTAAYALSGGAAVEKAADEFALKYPASELRPYLYSKAMHEYQTAGDRTRMLAMGEKVLDLDPEDPVALVLTATVLADTLTDVDLDRDQKIAEIKNNATRALETMDATFIAPPGATHAQTEAYKTKLRGLAHAALGIMELKSEDYFAAEEELQAAADLSKTAPDPYVWYNLALAQDNLQRYSKALASINQALQHITANPELEQLAQSEREKLLKLTGSPAPAKPANKKPADKNKPQQ